MHKYESLHALKHSCTHAREQTHTHTHTRTRARARAHTHTSSLWMNPQCLVYRLHIPVFVSLVLTGFVSTHLTAVSTFLRKVSLQLFLRCTLVLWLGPILFVPRETLFAVMMQHAVDYHLFVDDRHLQQYRSLPF